MTLTPELRERLLEASPDELREIARAHPEAAPAVRALLAANAELAEALRSPRAEAAPRTESPASPQPVGGAADVRRVRPAFPLGLLAAAALAAVTLWPTTGPESPVEDVDSTARAGPAPAITSIPDLDVESDSDFVVLPTRNPDIAVVWFISGDAP